MTVLRILGSNIDPSNAKSEYSFFFSNVLAFEIARKLHYSMSVAEAIQ